MGRTARRVTWTCQEGSGSLLGYLISCNIADRLIRFGVNRFDLFGTGETHDRRHPGLRPFLDMFLADAVAEKMRSAALANSDFLEAA